MSINAAIAANPSLPGRSPDSGFGPVGGESGANGDPGGGSAAAANGQTATGDSGSAHSSGSTPGSGSTGSAGGTTSGQKAGPSAPTRNVQGSSRARSRAAAAAGSQSATAAQDTGNDGSSNFGSVMATALGRSPAGGTDADPSTKGAATTDGAAGSANTVQPATAAPTDAAAWLAQLMMAPGAAQASVAASVTGGTDATANGRVGAAGTKGGPRPGWPAPGAANADDTLENPAAPGNAAVANRLKFTGEPLPQGVVADAGKAAVQTADAQAADGAAANTPGAANVDALADVQKMISGLSDTNSAPGANSGAVATPATHGTAAAGSMDAAQAAAALQASSLTRTGAGLGTTTLTIRAPVGSAAFADEVSSRVTGLAQSGITQAQLQLNPTDLGPVQVHITMQDGQASVWFGATHADTRAALEQSLPRLREMFAGAGLPLSDSGVFREPPQQQPAPSLHASGTSRATVTESAATTTVTQVANVRLALLDTYA